jgi:hypothetical protein
MKKLKKPHICKPCDYCICSTLDFEEPDENCPIHGCPNPITYMRCIFCGRFMPYKIEKIFKDL